MYNTSRMIHGNKNQMNYNPYSASMFNRATSVGLNRFLVFCSSELSKDNNELCLNN